MTPWLLDVVLGATTFMYGSWRLCRGERGGTTTMLIASGAANTAVGLCKL